MNAIYTLNAELDGWKRKLDERTKTCCYLKAELCLQTPINKRKRAALAQKQMAVDELANKVRGMCRCQHHRDREHTPRDTHPTTRRWLLCRLRDWTRGVWS